MLILPGRFLPWVRAIVRLNPLKRAMLNALSRRAADMMHTAGLSSPATHSVGVSGSGVLSATAVQRSLAIIRQRSSQVDPRIEIVTHPLMARRGERTLRFYRSPARRYEAAMIASPEFEAIVRGEE